MTVLSDQKVDTSFLWLEITGKCNLACAHCYADSGPTGTHGDMTEADWQRVIDQFASLAMDGDSGRQNQPMVQFIGGEPTANPLLPGLVRYALDRGLLVEVFSNLVAVSRRVWQVLRLPGVSVATSYYSGKAEEHEAITATQRSHRKTTANIKQAVEYGVPLRVGVIQITDDQDIEGAYRLLAEAGVENVHIGFDRLREVGRGVREGEAGMDQLCGNCGSGNAAVLPDGRVTPCVFSRWMAVGNVRKNSLADILGGSVFMQTRATLADHFGRRHGAENICGPSSGGGLSEEACLPPRKCGPHSGDLDEVDYRIVACGPIQTCKPVCQPGKHVRTTTVDLCVPAVLDAPAPSETVDLAKSST